MKKTGVLFVLSFLLVAVVVAQKNNIYNVDLLRQKEDSMRPLAQQILLGKNKLERLQADSLFTRILTRSLNIRNSFYYPFDSLKSVSKVYAPDSTFRIITWQLPVEEDFFRQHGAIQMRTADGSLQLFPLIDKSDIIENVLTHVGDNKSWIGALYYNIVQKKVNNQNVYFLFGFDEDGLATNKKLIDVLQFMNGKPVFGAPLFNLGGYTDGAYNNSRPTRFVITYKEEAFPKLNFMPTENAVVFDALISETGTPEKKYTLVPNGFMHALVWNNSQWQYQDDLYNGEKPIKVTVPMPIKSNMEKLPDAATPTPNANSSQKSKKPAQDNSQY